MDDINTIIERITERYESPIRVGSRCEANVFYRIEDLRGRDLEIIGDYVADRVLKVCSPTLPQAIISLPGSLAGLATILSQSLAPAGEALDVVDVEQLRTGNGRNNWLRGMNVILVNDVITTARSCLESHSLTTLLGASVLSWAAIIDRTFGPGPVPVVAAHTGEPVVLLEQLP